MRFSPGLAGSRETVVILGQSRHSRAVSTVLDVSRSFSVSSRGLVCITGQTGVVGDSIVHACGLFISAPLTRIAGCVGALTMLPLCCAGLRGDRLGV
jgi:hypothetical protein